jgi:taurine---2-oxoglutarate transaminase
MAKGITSGYAPLGAVAMKPEIATFFDHRVYQGGLTFNAHPISLAAAIANIDVLKTDGLIGKAAENGKVMAELLTGLQERHPSVGEVRSIGLFGVIELVRNRQTKEPLAPYNASSPQMVALRADLLEQGVFLYTHWHTVLLLPPLIISPEQLVEGFEALDRALRIPDDVVQ